MFAYVNILITISTVFIVHYDTPVAFFCVQINLFHNDTHSVTSSYLTMHCDYRCGILELLLLSHVLVFITTSDPMFQCYPTILSNQIIMQL